MKRLILISLSAAALCSGCTGPDFRPYGVRIDTDQYDARNEDDRHVCRGMGVYLNDGYVVTVAHIMDPVSIFAPKIITADDAVEHAGVMAVGNRDVADAAILRMDPEQLSGVLKGLPPMTLCEAAPTVGEDVAVVFRGKQVHATILESPSSYRGLPLMDLQADHGDSGSGVFSIKGKCLLGLLSRGKITDYESRDGKTVITRNEGSYFTSASQIKMVADAKTEAMNWSRHKCPSATDPDDDDD